MEEHVINIESDILRDVNNHKDELKEISNELNNVYGGRKILINQTVMPVETTPVGSQNLLLLYHIELEPASKRHIKYRSPETGQDLHEYGKYAKHRKFIAKTSFDTKTNEVTLYGVYPLSAWIECA